MSAPSVHPPATTPARIGAARRLLDVVVSLTALVALLPLLLFLAALVRCTSRGPALFRQVRVGAAGQPFVLLKYRSMTAAAPGGPQVTTAADARVTSVGRFLRRTSLDELPQLLNVLRGRMTLVGPRPETIELAARYPVHCRWVLQHTPGLTGPCQLRLRDREAVPTTVADVEEYYLTVLVPRKVAVDATFLRSPSLVATLGVLAQTAGYLLGWRPPEVI
jgi:lipopolysaccharide/colanic/teichoic acid biosynthesis glycosyltransferase